MVVEISSIKINLGISTSDVSQDDMFNKHLTSANLKFSEFSDTLIDYYATYLSAVTIKFASRVNKDADVTYFKVDTDHWLELANNQYEEEVALNDNISDYAVIKIENVRVD